LFEGEGCIAQLRYRSPGRVGVCLTLSSTDRDVIERFQRVVRAGVLRKKSGRTRPAHYKTLWEWRVQQVSEVERILALFDPYLGKRRKAKAEKALFEVTVLPRGQRQRLKTHCKNGHKYTSENTYVTPKGTRQCRTCQRDRARERKGKA
jgi:hypothetical protein